jgi:N-acyl-D-amino-acid deacylase
MRHAIASASLILSLAWISRTNAAEPIPAALDQAVADAMKAFEVPGAAVAIVHDDKVIYLKGFGVRRLGEREEVTADTVFAIASCSKAFTSTGIAMLVAEGKMKWDDPVRKHIEWFHLSDPSADRDVTIRDLLCHRTGMPRHDALWASAPNSPEDYIRAYGKAKPSTSFRSTWEYANIPFTTAGIASGNAAGTEWQTLIRQRILEPLGMKTASCTGREAIETGNNRHVDGKIGPVHRENVDSVRGAGSINASARDMSQWLRFQLADGAIDGKRLLPAGVLKETRKSQMVVRQEGRWLTFFPEKSTRFLSYGLGWFVHDYRGQVAVSHGGTLDGFRAQTFLIPDKKLGIVVFGNLTPSRFPEALSKTLTDLMLGLADEDWNAFYTKSDVKAEADRRDALKKHEKERKPDTKPNLPLASYAGIYTEPAYGRAEVIAGKDGLTLKWGRLTYKLEHYHFDTFTGTVIAPADDALGSEGEFETATFRLSPAGEIAGLHFLNQDFQRSKEAAYDTIIRGGTVYDGSGKAPRQADVGLRGDKIAAIGDLSSASAKTVIDAKGQAVAPGFINMLSWSTDSLLVDGRGQSEIRQGVTTEIMGEGWSWGPVNDAIRKRMKTAQTDFKYDIEWTLLSEYLYFLQRKGTSHNVASYVGATTVREYVLGEGKKKPTPEELERMCKLVEQEMKAGALGVGTALEYSPAYYADTDELIALCKVAAKYHGKYITHMRSEGTRLLEGIDEVIRICREAKLPCEIYHLKAAGPANWKKMDEAIAKIEAARKEGLPITANMYPYTAGAAPLTACIPPWAQEGGEAPMRKRLKNPDERKRVIEDILRPKYEWPNFYANAGGAKGIVLLGLRKDALKPLQGKSLAEVAKMRKSEEPVEVLLDLLIEDESSIGVAYFITAEENIKKIVPLSWISFGSDESSQAPEGVFLKSIPHPRAYGCFARVLSKYVRDEKLLTLELAVRKLSELPATNLGLDRRGSLKEGYFADVIVFDPMTIQDKATYENPHQYAVGMKNVFVNGVQVLKDGEHTGAKPGRAVWGPGRVD